MQLNAGENNLKQRREEIGSNSNNFENNFVDKLTHDYMWF